MESNPQNIVPEQNQQTSEQMEMEQPQVEQQAQQFAEETMGISSMVNSEMTEQLMSMGFTKEVAEKALFLTQSQNSVEAAMEWIEQNQEAPDFLEELRIVKQQDKPKKDKETIQREARELQVKLRQQRAEKDKQLEIEQEKERLRSTKELQQAKVALEEAERKRAIEAQIRERKEFEIEKKRMQEQLRRDKEERFGKKFGGEGESSEAAQSKSPEELLQHAIKTIKTLYPEYNFPGVAKTCLQTLQVYVNNAIEHPEEREKFGKIKVANNAFQNRVAKVTGGLMFLRAAGFQDQVEFYVLVDTSNLKTAFNYLQDSLSKMG